MTKKILSLALVAMSMVSFSSMARTQQSDSCSAKEGCKTCTCTCNDCSASCNGCKASCGMPDLFTGMTLTDAQKTQLQELKAKRCSAKLDKMKARKAKRQHNDSTRMVDRRADRKQYLEEVKAIVGPDQYVIYLENVVLNTPDGHARHHQGFMKASKKDKIGKKSIRTDKTVDTTDKTVDTREATAKTGN